MKPRLLKNNFALSCIPEMVLIIAGVSLMFGALDPSSCGFIS